MKSLKDVITGLSICDHNEIGEACQNCPYSITLCDGKTRVAWFEEYGNGDCMKELTHDALTYLRQLEQSGLVYSSEV